MFYLLNGIVRHQFVGGFWKRFSCVDRFVRFVLHSSGSVVLNCDDQHLMRLVIHLGKRGEELVLILNLSRRFEHAQARDLLTVRLTHLFTQVNSSSLVSRL